MIIFIPPIIYPKPDPETQELIDEAFSAMFDDFFKLPAWFRWTLFILFELSMFAFAGFCAYNAWYCYSLLK